MSKQVYFIGCKAFTIGAIKIGVSENPSQRLETLQRHSPIELQILAVKNGEFGEEYRLHEQFAKDRLWGEWFARSPELMSLIKELKENPIKLPTAEPLEEYPNKWVKPPLRKFGETIIKEFRASIEDNRSPGFICYLERDPETLWVRLNYVISWWYETQNPKIDMDYAKHIVTQHDDTIGITGPKHKRLGGKYYWCHGIYRKDDVPIYEPSKELIVNIGKD